jgi:hypothetical protein
VASKQDHLISNNWLENEALMDLKITRRVFPTKQGSSSLVHFDGATMKKYRYPSRIMEEIYCRNPTVPESCHHGHGLDPEIPNTPLSELFSGETKDINVCLNPNISHQSYWGIESLLKSVQIDPSTAGILSKSIKNCASHGCRNQVVASYMDSFGVDFGTVRYL